MAGCDTVPQPAAAHRRCALAAIPGRCTSTCAPQLRIQGCISSGSETCTCSRQPPSGVAWICWEGCQWRSSTKGLAAAVKRKTTSLTCSPDMIPQLLARCASGSKSGGMVYGSSSSWALSRPRQLEGADIAGPFVVADDVDARGRRFQGIGSDNPLAQFAAARRTIGDLDFTPAAPAFGDGFQDGYLCRVGAISFYPVGGALQVHGWGTQARWWQAVAGQR